MLNAKCHSMSRKNKIFIIIIIILILIIVVLAVIAPLLEKNANGDNSNLDAGGQGNINSGNLNLSANIALPSPTPNIVASTPKTQSILEAIARTFAEKFGSFSSQGNYENLGDLEFYMTEDMKDWAKKYIANDKKKKGAEFYGVTTRALKAEIIALNDEETQAQAVVTTQREETHQSEAGRKNIIYQKLVLDFLKIDQDWKVNSAEWK